MDQYARTVPFVAANNCAYLSISVHICQYLYICVQSNFRVQSQMSISVHMCLYLIISVCIIFISVHIHVYLLLSVHICLYQVYIRQYLHVSELYPCIYAYICAYLCIYVYIQKLHFEGEKPNF